MTDHGELVTVEGHSAIRFERRLRHDIDTVWRAVTEPEQLRAWFPTTIDGDRRAGAPLSFRLEEMPDHEPVTGEMLTFDPPRRMSFRWGPDEIRIELTEEADGTRLVLLDVLAEHGKAARDAAGWHTCLDALELHLAGRGDRSVLTSRWADVHPGYVAAFGPQAATIGPPEGR